MYRYASLNDGNTFKEMCRQAISLLCKRHRVYLYNARYCSLLHTQTIWYSLLLLGFKTVQHVTVLNTVGNCNRMVSIIILYYNIMGPAPYVRSVVDREVFMRHMTVIFMISGFRRRGNEIFALLRCYAPQICGYLPTFRDSQSVPFSGVFGYLNLEYQIVCFPETSVTNYQSTLRNIPEERTSLL